MYTAIQNFYSKTFNYFNKTHAYLTKNPRLFLVRKLARFEVLRNGIHYLFKNKKESEKISQFNHDYFENIDLDIINSSLKENGYYSGLNLPQHIVEQILEFAESNICYGNRDPKLYFYLSNKKQAEISNGKQFLVGSYLHNIEKCPAINKMKTEPGLLAIAAKFLEARPVHIASELVWSFPVSTEWIEQLNLAQVFHYDIDDYKFLKFFFYLTNVDMFNGPHVCIRGSHKNKKFLHQLIGLRCANLDDKKIVDYYGDENLVNFYGPAGFGFVEDPFCFHKGTPPTDKARLFLQLEFAINNYKDIRSFK
jgi:hypothetical protein